jgi:tRNA-uridine 2-sulfurtransferase
MQKKIAVAISGGIDSLVAAFLLKKKFDVFGIHFITGLEKEKLDIDFIADQLDIEIKTVNIEKDFKKIVVDYFIDSYKNAKTPNPCLVCNPFIKFGIILNFALKNGAQKLATGHYAQIKTSIKTDIEAGIETSGNKISLLKGKDKKKDQSYFLAFLKQNQLELASFPLGEFTKEEVKKIAKENNLAPLSAKESNDICFIKDETYSDFLKRQKGFKKKSGLIEDMNGNIIGEHKGIHFFTIGQRKGIGCPAKRPYYVVKKDFETNKITVGFKEDLFSEKCKVSNINWIETFYEPVKIDIRLRYRHKPAPAMLFPKKNKAEIVFDNPQSAAAPGQGAVFYIKDKVIGGGFID